jgi:hypothetical protein
MPRARSPRVDPSLTEQPIDIGDLMFKARLCGESFRSIAARFGVPVREVEQAVEDRCTAITPDARQRALRIELERLDELRALRTITESQFVVMRRSDSGVGDSGALRMGVGRSHDRRGGHLATMGSGRLEAR